MYTVIVNNPPAAKITQVTSFQAKVALDHFDLLDAVEVLMADPAAPRKINIAWTSGADFKRHSDMVLSMAEILNIDDAQLDALFEFASTVE